MEKAHIGAMLWADLVSELLFHDINPKKSSLMAPDAKKLFKIQV